MTAKKSTNGGTRKCKFEIKAPDGSKVFIAGTFNNWDPTAHKMRKGAKGVYSTTLELSPGRHEYKFLVNDEWQADANCPDWAPNGLGSLNSVIEVS
ncbi:MAG: glycogen-binding domain-containing protein [Kiritimatiellae bacterium]|nr:glycogen-binding domain-containing protein [Kiritimatiellia bacterium]